MVRNGKRHGSAHRRTRSTWEEYFCEMALLVASRSRDESQVGSVIVGEDNEVISTGYNGLPREVADLQERLEQKEK
jgi:dCMP deaminase